MAAALLLLPAAPRAGPTLGLRVAWAPAIGSAADLVPMSEEIPWQAPVQAEVLWRSGEAAVGLYGSWGPGGAGSCGDGASCSAQAIRAGAQGLWDFRPGRLGAAPWVGAAFGWEWAWHRRDRLGAETTRSWSGPEAALQAGLAWEVGDRLTFGPFVLLGAGRYARLAVETPEASASGSIVNAALHAWVHLGVRGTLEL